jgi:hypothetical protein
LIFNAIIKMDEFEKLQDEVQGTGSGDESNDENEVNTLPTIHGFSSR